MILYATADEPYERILPQEVVEKFEQELKKALGQDFDPAESSQPSKSQSSLSKQAEEVEPITQPAPNTAAQELQETAPSQPNAPQSSLSKQAEAEDSTTQPAPDVPTSASTLEAALDAAKNGELDKAQSLLQQVTAAAMEQLLRKSPGLVNERYTKDDHTLLHIAILARNEAVATVLIDNASDLEIQDDDGRTPLLLAAEENLLGVVQHLLTKEAKVNTEDDYGHTPIHAAAKNGHRDMAELLLKNKATIEAQDECQNTPLHWASREGQEAVVELLLEKGANTKATDEYGRTARTLAEIEWHVKVMDLLECSTVDQNCGEVCQAVVHKNLDRIRDMLAQEGISITQETVRELEELKEVVDLIKAQSYKKVCQVVKEHRDLDSIKDMLVQKEISITQALSDHENTLLYLAIQHDWAELVRFVIGFIINHEPAIMHDPEFVPLHWAVAAGKTGMAQLLLSSKLIGSKRVELERKNAAGQTALQLAIDKQLVEVLYGSKACQAVAHRELDSIKGMLIRKEISITQALDADNNTLLHLAIQNDWADLARLVIVENQGVDLECKDEEGQTALLLAIRKQQTGIAKLLLASEASVNTKDDCQYTPMHAVAQVGDLAMARLLFRYKATLEVQDEQLHTPLHWAAREGHVALVKFFVSKGADLQAEDEYGRTPLELAEMEERQEVAAFLKKCRKAKPKA